MLDLLASSRHERLTALGDAGRSMAVVLTAIVAGLASGGILLASVGYQPIQALVAMVDGAFGSHRAWIQLLTYAVPLTIIGLGLAVCFSTRVYNVGAEGQFLLGALAGTAFALRVDAGPRVIMVILTLLVGTFAGFIWGFVPGWLLARWSINEVITTLLLNYVATFAFAYSFRRPLRSDGMFPGSEDIPPSAELGPIPGLDVHAGIVIAIMLVPLVWWLMERTPSGFHARFVGANPDAAEVVGAPRSRIIAGSLALSGALAGLAGAVQVMGVAKHIQAGISPGYGFTAIVVALLARNRAWAIVPASLFMAGLATGGQAMAVGESVPFGVVLVVQAMFVIFLLIADRLGPR